MRPEGLVQRLIERGLVDAERVVDGDLVVRDVSRRNRNFRVQSERGPSLFVKHAPAPEQAPLLAQEAAALEAIQGDATLAAGVPRVRLYDPGERLLVTDLVRDVETLHERHARLRTCPPDVAAALGAALARVHAAPVTPGIAARLRPAVPLAFQVGLLPNAGSRDLSGGAVKLLGVLDEFPDVRRHLDALLAEWRPACVVHGDLKWDNALVADAPGGPRVTLVDWEGAGLGDPAWDVGCVFVDHLAFWLGSVPVTGETPPERAAELAAVPLGSLAPALRAFWASYGATLGLSPPEAGALLERATRHAGARLVQLAFEQVQTLPALTGTAVLTLQLAHNVLQRPRDAAIHLLALPDAFPGAPP
ncbi:MAG TPA: phosphotransferase [Candidatus Thermoplasmatota archaeon]|nr:phosphotransferase [Candidatus Thermoplasmatota archaeon]